MPLVSSDARPVATIIATIKDAYAFLWREKSGIVWAMLIPLAAYLCIRLIVFYLDIYLIGETVYYHPIELNPPHSNWHAILWWSAKAAYCLVDAVFLYAVHCAVAAGGFGRPALLWRIGRSQLRYFFCSLVFVGVPLFVPTTSGLRYGPLDGLKSRSWSRNSRRLPVTLIS